MSTLVRKVTLFVLATIFFGSFFFIESLGCLVQTNLDTISVPFCTTENFTKPYFNRIRIEQKAILVQKMLLFIVVLLLVIALKIPNVDSGVYRIHKLIYLVRFGPYQKKYPIILPSYQ